MHTLLLAHRATNKAIYLLKVPEQRLVSDMGDKQHAWPMPFILNRRDVELILVFIAHH